MLNLLLDFGEMGRLLHDRLTALAATPALDADEVLLDAFLLAGGMNQVLEDYLHRDVGSIGRAAPHLPQLLGARAGTLGARAALGVRGATVAIREHLPPLRELAGRQEQLACLVDRLAQDVARGSPPDPATLLRGDAAVAELLATSPPALRASVVRLAQCFRSFDQRPADCRRLAALVAGRFGTRDRPVLVVGLRTSGSYLGPLCAAYLQLAGYEDVATVTHRPGDPWLGPAAIRVARAAREDHLVCVVDDPPRTGGQLALTAEELGRAGVGDASLVLLLQLVGTAETIPPALARHQSVVLPWSEWSVVAALAPGAVSEALNRLVVGRRVADVEVAGIDLVERVGGPPAPVRGHARAVFRVLLQDARSGERHEYQVLATGVGLGYLGRHALSVADALSGRVPQVLALEHGLLFRAWLPEERRLAAAEPRLARGVASYVAARRDALGVERDTSARLTGRGAVWELVADMLSDAYGRGKYAVRPVAARAARRLVRPDRPAVVDGSMSLDHWFLAPSDDGLLKVGFDRRAFSNEDTYCYDAAFDLASAAADHDARVAFEACDDGFGDALRAEYERSAVEAIPEERWLLYRLLHHHRAERRVAARGAGADRPADRLAAETAMARACQQYFGTRYFADLEPPSGGPVCAIDVDWVLETRWLGFPALSPAGARVLRALTRHGYRPVLATGRSLLEVRDRCAAYRLAGGVAEYGAAVYDHRTGRARSLLTADEEDELRALRAALAELPGVWLDPRYERSIRAYRVGADGRRSGLDAATVERSLARTGGADRIRAWPAESQTDFTAARVDKGTGVQGLASALAGGVALAVGDSLSDLPMLRRAQRAFAPANAEAPLRRAGANIEVVGRPCQAGLALAVASFLGHEPAGCPLCEPPAVFTADARLLLAVLAALEGSGQEKLRQAGALALNVLKRPRPAVVAHG
jgi:hydroxymethylpyrimidine pyrophosphatase-like HAD family hydrolase